MRIFYAQLNIKNNILEAVLFIFLVLLVMHSITLLREVLSKKKLFILWTMLEIFWEVWPQLFITCTKEKTLLIMISNLKIFFALFLRIHHYSQHSCSLILVFLINWMLIIILRKICLNLQIIHKINKQFRFILNGKIG